jgi:hypothetical protein
MASVVMVVSGANVWTMKNAKPHSDGVLGRRICDASSQVYGSWTQGHGRKSRRGGFDR